MDKSSAPPQPQPPPYTVNDTPPGVHQPYVNAQPGFAPAPPPYYQPVYPITGQPTALPAGYVPTYGATNIIITPPIIAIGACPACRVGILEDEFTCLGFLCAIMFFPLGILCCLAMKNRRCSNCRAYFA